MRLTAAGPLAFAAAGVLFVVYPAARPWGDSTPAGSAAAFASPAWLVAHLAAVAAFVLAGVGLAALHAGLRTGATGATATGATATGPTATGPTATGPTATGPTATGTTATGATTAGPGRGTRAAAAALGTWVAGAALVLPYYGSEAYALHGLAAANVPDVAGLAQDVRMGTVALTAFCIGLGLLALSAVLAAVTTARAGLGRLSGTAFAAGMVLFLPQFFADAPLRIAHGVLLGAGCLLLARALVRLGSGNAPVTASTAAGETMAGSPR